MTRRRRATRAVRVTTLIPGIAAAIRLELAELRGLELMVRELVVHWLHKHRQSRVERLVERPLEGSLLQRRAREDPLRRRNEISIKD